MSEEAIDRCAAAAKGAWEDGCPVAGHDEAAWTKVAQVAARRWQSINRRTTKPPTRDEQIEDLAKGLRDRFEVNPNHVGPLMEDYRWLASRLADVLTQ